MHSERSFEQKRLNYLGLAPGYAHTPFSPNLGEKGVWAYPGTAQIFFEYLLLSQERVKLRISNKAGIYSQGPSEQKPL